MSPIIRKIHEISGSKLIALPKSWIEFFERKHGTRITEVAIEIDDVLKVMPLLEKVGEKTPNSKETRHKQVTHTLKEGTADG